MSVADYKKDKDETSVKFAKSGNGTPPPSDNNHQDKVDLKKNDLMNALMALKLSIERELARIKMLISTIEEFVESNNLDKDSQMVNDLLTVAGVLRSLINSDGSYNLSYVYDQVNAEIKELNEVLENYKYIADSTYQDLSDKIKEWQEYVNSLMFEFYDEEKKTNVEINIDGLWYKINDIINKFTREKLLGKLAELKRKLEVGISCDGIMTNNSEIYNEAQRIFNLMHKYEIDAMMEKDQKIGNDKLTAFINSSLINDIEKCIKKFKQFKKKIDEGRSKNNQAREKFINFSKKFYHLLHLIESSSKKLTSEQIKLIKKIDREADEVAVLYAKAIFGDSYHVYKKEDLSIIEEFVMGCNILCDNYETSLDELIGLYQQIIKIEDLVGDKNDDSHIIQNSNEELNLQRNDLDCKGEFFVLTRKFLLSQKKQQYEETDKQRVMDCINDLLSEIMANVSSEDFTIEDLEIYRVLLSRFNYFSMLNEESKREIIADAEAFKINLLNKKNNIK